MAESMHCKDFIPMLQKPLENILTRISKDETVNNF